ncbi:MAG: HPr family phosphocarrier protein [Clostridiales bacterium]|nr:HPr family phosphocarrier protein [Clostridiales bacterium]
MTYNIRITSSADAQRLNAIAQKYPFDIFVHGVQGHADAKSMLGLMLFTIENDLKLVIEDEVDAKRFEKDIKEFLV